MTRKRHRSDPHRRPRRRRPEDGRPRTRSTTTTSWGGSIVHALATVACVVLVTDNLPRYAAFTAPTTVLPTSWNPTGRRSSSPTTTTTTTTTRKMRSTGRLHMNFLSEFLGSFQDRMNQGGSYNLGIDYDALAFPGPEVAAMARNITAARRTASTAEPEGGFWAPAVSPSLPHLELATFAGGCFWGLQLALQRCEGVVYTLVGYTQGGDDAVRPNYEQVAAGNTGHCEAVLVYFDPSRVSYEDLVRRGFLDRVDVTTVDGQGKDRGPQYRTGLFVHTPAQDATARRALADELATNPRYHRGALATQVRPAKAFWPAEEYHQRYLEKGGRFGRPQSAETGNTDEIRCYG